MENSPLAITAQEITNGALSSSLLHSSSSLYVPVPLESIFSSAVIPSTIPGASIHSSSSTSSSVASNTTISESTYRSAYYSSPQSTGSTTVLSEAETFHIQNLIGKPIPVHCSGDAFLLWNPDDIVRLRTLGNLALNPIGNCSTKLATKGKVGSVPVLLSDEELYTLYYNRWIDYAKNTNPSLNIINDGVPSTVTHSYTSTSKTVSSSSSSTLSDSWSNYASQVTFTTVDNYLRKKGEENNHLILRRNVFYNLWYNHYYCTIGIKFGVTYLAYRNDPTAVHAAYMIIVQPENSGITPLDLLARSRVATTALKICVIAWSTRTPYYLTRTTSIMSNPNSDSSSSSSSSSSSLSSNPVREMYSPLILPRVHYAAFKRMGPGTAIFADYAAQEEARKRDDSYYYQTQSTGTSTTMSTDS